VKNLTTLTTYSMAFGNSADSITRMDPYAMTEVFPEIGPVVAARRTARITSP
jgi:hypothetical protein